MIPHNLKLGPSSKNCFKNGSNEVQKKFRQRVFFWNWQRDVDARNKVFNHFFETTDHLLVAVTLLGLMVWSPVGRAIQVLPMEQEFDPQKTKNLEFVINNTNGEERVVEITLFARSQNEKGQEVRAPSKDFFIVPRQTKILAGQHQTVKLIWQGSSELLKEQAYRLIIEQLPIDLPQSQSPSKTETTEKTESIEKQNEAETVLSKRLVKSEGSHSFEKNVEKMEKNFRSKNQIEFLYKFVASIYARPLSAAAKIEFEVGAMDEKKKSLKLVVVNSGLAHQLLSKGQLILEGAQLPLHKMALSEVPNLHNLNLMAGSRVNIEIPWKEKFPPTKVSFDEKDN